MARRQQPFVSLPRTVWHEYTFDGAGMVVVAMVGDVRSVVRVFHRCNALDWRVSDSRSVSGRLRCTARDVRPLSRLIAATSGVRVPDCSVSVVPLHGGHTCSVYRVRQPTQWFLSRRFGVAWLVDPCRMRRRPISRLLTNLHFPDTHNSRRISRNFIHLSGAPCDGRTHFENLRTP